MIAVSSLFFWEYRIVEILDILREIGIKAIEFFPENPDFWDNRFNEDYLKEVEREIKKFEVSVHCPHIELNPCSFNHHIREICIKETLWSLELAERFKAKILTIHPGKRPVNREPTEEEHEHLKNYLKAIKERENKVKICLENMPKKINRLCWHPKEVKFYSETFNIPITLDFAHAKHYVKDFIELDVGHIHISGVCNGKDHFPLKESEINFIPYLEKILDRKYRGIITLELDDRRIKRHDKEYKIEVILKDLELLDI
ncbi:sugar phosphate isomerase/epimerase family protein [Methanocaldococcus infernus]